MYIFLLKERRMIDQRRLCAKGGDGGNGCISFHRSRHDRRGKADGEHLFYMIILWDFFFSMVVLFMKPKPFLFCGM